jgi:hypothetical protein
MVVSRVVRNDGYFVRFGIPRDNLLKMFQHRLCIHRVPAVHIKYPLRFSVHPAEDVHPLTPRAGFHRHRRAFANPAPRRRRPVCKMRRVIEDYRIFRVFYRHQKR